MKPGWRVQRGSLCLRALARDVHAPPPARQWRRVAGAHRRLHRVQFTTNPGRMTAPYTLPDTDCGRRSNGARA